LTEEIAHKSPRVTLAKDGPYSQDEEQLTKDLAEELRYQTVNNLHIYHDETAQWRNKKVNPHQINSGDMVLIRKQNAKMTGKLQPKWLRPYLATQSTRPRAFTLAASCHIPGISTTSTNTTLSGAIATLHSFSLRGGARFFNEAVALPFNAIYFPPKTQAHRNGQPKADLHSSP
jgi:hypothetical protein